MLEIRLEDLWKRCDKCKGYGRNVEMSGSFGQVTTIDEICRECCGNGGTTTDSGKAVLDFMTAMKRQGRI